MTGVFGPARGGTAWAIGSRLFFWPELRTRDAIAARRFYTAVLGCRLELLFGGTTAVLSLGDRVIGAISESSRSEASADHWRVYLVKGSSVAHGATATEKGAVFRGHLAGAPGAQLAADQAAVHFGGACGSGREAVLWFEPERDGPDASRGSSIGAAEAVGRAALLEATVCDDFGDPRHEDASGVAGGPRLFHNDMTNAGAGVLVGLTEPGGIAVSNVCLTVDDCAGALRRARAAGGTIVGKPTDLATGGRVAAVIDPQGAAFFCWQPSAAEASRVWPRARALTAPAAGSRRSALDARARTTDAALRFLRTTQRRAR